MLTEIIKRNGKKVPFDLEKLHNWIIWAGETIADRVNWSEIVLETLGQLKDGATTTELQNKLIQSCINQGDYPHNLMAGRLFAAVYRKEVFGKIEPLTIKQQHEKLQALGLMVKLNFNDDEYAEMEKIIDHSRDFDLAHFQLKQAYNKYALRDATTKSVYETPQFIFMRMAMALAEDEPTKTKLRDAKNWYKYFSELKISAPTPNYTNLGTRQRGYASCCVIKADDNLDSIGAADHATMRMSANAAGIGTHYAIRSINDPVRNGLIRHGGKMPYFRSAAFQAKENLQSGARGGAITQYVSVYDPDIWLLIRMQNPTTVKTMQIRESHFAVIMNTFLLKKAAKREQVFHFNAYTAPDLYEAMFSGDQEEFATLYEKYENDPKFEKVYFNPRELLIDIKKEALAAGTLYLWNADIANTQTPFKDKIYSSNLCLEIDLPTSGAKTVMELYSSDENTDSEIAICSLGAIVVPAIKSDAEYERVAYYTMKMIDKCVDLSYHPFENVRVKAQLRRSAGIGMIGVATSVAKAKVSYISEEGRKLIHEIAERHYYYCMKASLLLGQELGNAGWIEKTRYPDGWLAFEHAAPGVPSFPLKYDWETLRSEIIANGGIRNSVVCAIAPTESSAKFTSYPNAVYPVREAVLKKSDGENTVDWVAYDNDKLHYESSWDIPVDEWIKTAGIFQKFLDQGLSLDLYYDRSKNLDISAGDILQTYVAIFKNGLKSIYYTNSRITSDKTSIFAQEVPEETAAPGNVIHDGADDCESCTL